MPTSTLEGGDGHRETLGGMMGAVEWVRTLGPASYKSFLELAGDGADAVTHKALVDFDGTGAVDAYVKIYCSHESPKGLINEVAGYVLAKGDGLDVPERAAVLLLSPDQTGFLPPNIKPHATSNGLVAAWCVQSIGGKTPKQSFNLVDCSALETLREDLAKWRQLAQVVSLDAWLLNEDRNMGNLIRTGTARYALIDHGRICTGKAWSPPVDRARMKHTNKVALAAWGTADIDVAPNEHRDFILAACDKHSVTLSGALTQLNSWLSTLLSPPEKADVEGFLGDRTISVGKHLRIAYEVLL